jgi:L-asparaginase
MHIQVFITGGTFDKEYNELNGSLYFKETHLHEMLQLGRSKLDLAITTLMMKDSLEFTDEDRHQIAEACKKTDSDKLIILPKLLLIIYITQKFILQRSF